MNEVSINMQKPEQVLYYLRIYGVGFKHIDTMWVVTEARRAYAKRTKSKNKSPTVIQMSLF